jgi:membrane-bound serine protease (ClpP class)
MVEAGLALMLIGVALLVAEARRAGGVLGVFGGIALAAGAGLATSGSGGGTVRVVAAVAAALVLTVAWVAVLARRQVIAARRRARLAGEALSGRAGVVRNWNGDGGQVFVEGSLWRARRSASDPGGPIDPGDAVVVERLSGVTLAVRRAEQWEGRRP